MVLHCGVGCGRWVVRVSAKRRPHPLRQTPQGQRQAVYQNTGRAVVHAASGSNGRLQRYAFINRGPLWQQIPDVAMQTRENTKQIQQAQALEHRVYLVFSDIQPMNARPVKY